MLLEPILGGMKSCVPFLSQFKGTGGSVGARYCYSVWLRHLALIGTSFPGHIPRYVVEFGPGDSVGTGITALLTGSLRYFALDVVEHANRAANLAVFDEVYELVKSRSNIPDDQEFPRLFPRLSSYGFSTAILQEINPTTTSAQARASSIRRQLGGEVTDTEYFRYVCPWRQTLDIAGESIDLVLGQVALQDMDDRSDDDVLASAFQASARWLRRGGLFSQQIDLSMPGARYWNDHWTYPDPVWRVVRGRRPYYINRAPLSRYTELCNAHGLSVVKLDPIIDLHGLPRKSLTKRFRTLTDSDLITRGVYLLAVKT